MILAVFAKFHRPRLSHMFKLTAGLPAMESMRCPDVITGPQQFMLSQDSRALTWYQDLDRDGDHQDRDDHDQQDGAEAEGDQLLT